MSRDIFGDTSAATHDCRHCGDPVMQAEQGHWVHVRGPGSFLNRCQHTVPYGQDAEPGDALRVHGRAIALKPAAPCLCGGQQDHPYSQWCG